VARAGGVPGFETVRDLIEAAHRTNSSHAFLIQSVAKPFLLAGAAGEATADWFTRDGQVVSVRPPPP